MRARRSAAFFLVMFALGARPGAECAGSGGEALSRDAEVRERSIESFEALLGRYPESAMRAPVLLLLGDLYAAREKARYLEAVARHERAVAAGEGGAPPVLAYAEAVRAFEEVARLGKEFPGSVEALHALGVCYDEMGRSDEAERALALATQLAPDASLRVASFLRLGDLRFSGENWEGAKEAYGSAEGAGADAEAEKLDYRIGWCHLKQGELSEAKARFTAALARALRSDLEARPQESLSEILRSLALVQVQTDPSDLDGYAGRFPDGPVRRAALAEYGEVLLDHDRPAQAEQAFRTVLRMDEGAPGAPEVHDRIIESLSAQERKGEAGAEMEAFVSRYAPGSAWWGAEGPEGDRAADLGERLLRNCWNAALIRFEAGSGADLRAAALLFERYTDELGGTRDCSRASLFAAEAWSRLGDFERSLSLYERVDEGELPEEEREFALRGAVLAHRSLERTDDGLARAARRYADAYPESEEAQKTLLVAAEREEDAGRLSSAFDLCVRAADRASPPLAGEAEARAARLAAALGEKAAAEEWYVRAASSADTGEEVGRWRRGGSGKKA
ncbi:MAG: tetratricopeptide repeat protein, partial [Candidatus Eisenbacteria bacterium]